MSKERFDHAAIEAAAQKKWEEEKLFETDLTDETREPYYLLFEFPYPSGDLHIGHWYAYAITDIYARFLRMKGKNVLFPIGFDAFGLPAENAAIKQGANPKEWTLANIEKMRGQIRSIGSSVDWSKEVVTCTPAYYKWTQWLFAKLYEHGLAVRKEAAVKWCPKDHTVLANEQVIDGKCERCDTPVEEKLLTQWFMSITKYADRLITDLDALPWREDIKDAQRAWIGKLEGAVLSFQLTADTSQKEVKVFTTRPDTIFGATYLVLAPEHPLLTDMIYHISNADEVREYVEATQKKTERERSENKVKTGVQLKGVMAVNPATKEEIPVYIADYVIGSYGTGAVMAVPAHDERDFEFAKKMDLPIRHVIAPDLVDEGNPPVEGKPIVTRHSVLAIVRNPKTEKYLGLKWKDQPWTTFITGGIDKGEDIVDAAMREVQEETGYKNLKLVRVLGGPVHARFFAAHKGENRGAVNTSILFDLIDEERDAVSDEELAKHEAQWLDLSEIAAEKMRHAEISYILERMQAEETAYTGPGVLVNSGEFSYRSNTEAMSDIVAAVGGERTTNYRIRDWLVSRQRYWGCPIPIVYDPEGNPHSIPAEHLPWLLPEDVDFTPVGDASKSAEGSKAPLASSKELQERVTRIFGEGWTPEYDTLDTFVDSSWYFLRYLNANDDAHFSDDALMKKWLPVDRYSGGSEHTTMHLLYARFFHKALYDLSLVPTSEPFNERYNRGLILGPDGRKMSKRWGNVINPDEMLKTYGADAVRMYLGFVGPYNEPGHYPWSLDGVSSMRKFLDRIYALAQKTNDGEVTEDMARALAKATTKIAEDSDKFKFNTAISALMILVKEFEAEDTVPLEAFKNLIRLLAPFAPHLAEHMWAAASGEGSVHASTWPAVDPDLLLADAVAVVVQVNGKRKGEISLAPDASEEDATAASFALLGIDGADVQRVIYVPGRVINVVV